MEFIRAFMTVIICLRAIGSNANNHPISANRRRAASVIGELLLNGIAAAWFALAYRDFCLITNNR
jgi:hypothetical protein